MKNKYFVICISLLNIFCVILPAQQNLNLDFEASTRNGDAIGWYLSGKGYELKVDTKIFYSGQQSLRVRKISGDKFATARINIPFINVKNNHIRFSGYIKTQGIKDGYASLWWSVRGKYQGKSKGFDYMADHHAAGFSDWTKYSVEIDVDTTVQNITFGIFMSGEGTAWFDNFQIDMDENIYVKNQKESFGLNGNQIYNGSNVVLEKANKKVVDGLALLCKLWGFLKYYHPKIASGNYNWDYELFKIIPQVINCKSKNEINKLELEWIKNLGDIKEFEDHKIIDTANVKIFPDLDWIVENSQFDEAMIKQLNQVKNAKRNSKNYYVDLFPLGNPNFKNEESYEKISYSDTGYRLLTLFRYWNIIQYFYPYRYFIKKEWDTVLLEFIPKFIDIKSELEYKLTLQTLIAKVHDTHANIWSDKILVKYFGSNNSPLEIRFIDNKAVVYDYFNDELGKKTKLLKGDIILSVDDNKVENIIKDRLPFIPASNYKVQLRSLSNFLLRSNKNRIKIEYERDGEIYQDSVDCYDPRSVNLYKKFSRRDTCWKFITKEIGYIYPGTIKNTYLPMIMSELKNTKGIIIDLRCYPSEFIVFTLGEYLMDKQKEFVKLTKGEIKSPGLFTFMKNIKIGRDNPNYYKGKVVILVDETTLSQAEYTAMAFRVAPNAIVIGSTTAAADGNVSSIFLPGGVRTLISGLGVYYPDGRETQQIGIIPDIYIKPTIGGIIEGRDEYLEKAIEVIEKSAK